MWADSESRAQHSPLVITPYGVTGRPRGRGQCRSLGTRDVHDLPRARGIGLRRVVPGRGLGDGPGLGGGRRRVVVPGRGLGEGSGLGGLGEGSGLRLGVGQVGQVVG